MISGVALPFGSCLTDAINMKSKKIITQWKDVIIKQKKKNTGESRSLSTIKRHLYSFTVQRNNDPNHTAKTTQEYLEDRFTNKQQLNMAAMKAWQTITGDETEFGEVHWL